MKKFAIIGALLGAAALAGCNSAILSPSASSNVSAVCTVGQAAGSVLAQSVSLVAAANPSNTQAASLLAKVNAGQSLAASDCAVAQAVLALAQIAISIK